MDEVEDARQDEPQILLCEKSDAHSSEHHHAREEGKTPASQTVAPLVGDILPVLQNYILLLEGQSLCDLLLAVLVGEVESVVASERPHLVLDPWLPVVVGRRHIGYAFFSGRGYVLPSWWGNESLLVLIEVASWLERLLPNNVGLSPARSLDVNESLSLSFAHRFLYYNIFMLESLSHFLH